MILVKWHTEKNKCLSSQLPNPAVHTTICKTHTHTHTHTLKNASLWRLLLFFPLFLYLRFSHRLCKQNSLWSTPVFRIPLWRPFVLVLGLHKVPNTHMYTHTHSQKCIPVETSIVFFFCCLTQDTPIDFVHKIPCGDPQSLEFPCGDLLFFVFSFVLGPRSPQGTEYQCTHTLPDIMALMGYLIVFSIVPFLKNSLVGYYCSYCNSLVGSIVLLLQVPHNLWRVRSHTHARTLPRGDFYFSFLCSCT